MPQLRAGEWVYDQGELATLEKDPEAKAENKPGHRPLSSYNLPKWVYHPDLPQKKIVVERVDYFGLAADGARNYENWNVAHVAAYHDDLKLLSLATLEQCKEPNKWGMTPTHMTGLGQHPYGPSLAVLYELVQMGVADPESVNHAEQTPWHICQRMHKPANLKKFEKVLLKGHKPDHYEAFKETQLRLRGKYARPATGVEDEGSGKPVCLVFPGQGAQYVGMMKQLKDLPAVKDMLAKANKILGYDVLEIMLSGPEDKLTQTKYCQPAIYIAEMAVMEQLKQDDPTIFSRKMSTAGLSLGEYTALQVAGVFDFETGLQIVKARAEAMDFEATRQDAQKQGMVTVAGLERDVVEKLCKECSAGKGEVCQIANHLFPKGFSCAGTESAILALEKKANEAGALQAKVVKASGAFHTPMMAGAKDMLLSQLEKMKGSMKSPTCQVYMNTTATAIGPNTPVSDIIKLMGEQLVNPVFWEQSMLAAIKDGYQEFLECGPGKQLKAMMKRIDPKSNDKMRNLVA